MGAPHNRRFSTGRRALGGQPVCSGSEMSLQPQCLWLHLQVHGSHRGGGAGASWSPRLRHTDPGLLCALPQHGARVRGRRSRGSSWLPAAGSHGGEPSVQRAPVQAVCPGWGRARGELGTQSEEWFELVPWAPPNPKPLVPGAVPSSHSRDGGICSCRVDDLGESLPGTQPLASDERSGPSAPSPIRPPPIRPPVSLASFPVTALPSPSP